MSTSTAVRTARRGSQGANVQPAITCLVLIGRGAYGSPTGLRVFPERDGDRTIYYPRADQKRWRKVPREVLWVAANLLEGETLLIRPKSPDPEAFDWPACEIEYPSNMVSSGQVTARAQTGARWRWAYEVILECPSAPNIILDPEIIIEPDPPGEEP